MATLLDYDQKAIVRAAIKKLDLSTLTESQSYDLKQAYNYTFFGGNTLFDNDVLELLDLHYMCDNVSYY